MKLWAELTMSLHQLDMASITEGGFGRRVMAFSCRRKSRTAVRVVSCVHTCAKFKPTPISCVCLGAPIERKVLFLTFLLLISGSEGWLAQPVLQASCSSSLIYASWHAVEREREGAVVKYDRIYKKGKEQKQVDSADEGARKERMSTKGKSAEKK